jgi:2-oxoglutarate ferredoxin oxidoreductase subunit delta
MIEITQDWCKGCELCVKYCPVQALKMGDEINKKGVYPPVLKEDNECNFCRLCELLCPDFAVTVIVEEIEEKKEKSKLRIGGVTNEV